jgi:threonine dehydratase
VVTDEEAQKAMSQAFARLKLVAEPGGAVALAAALYHGDQIDADTVICTISGGNVDRAVFLHALDQFGEG